MEDVTHIRKMTSIVQGNRQKKEPQPRGPAWGRGCIVLEQRREMAEHSTRFAKKYRRVLSALLDLHNYSDHMKGDPLITKYT